MKVLFGPPVGGGTTDDPGPPAAPVAAGGGGPPGPVPGPEPGPGSPTAPTQPTASDPRINPTAARTSFLYTTPSTNRAHTDGHECTALHGDCRRCNIRSLHFE